jgi:hypothetical protein
MSDEVIIGLGGLVIAVLAYFAGVWRTSRLHAADESQRRIRAVFEAYMIQWNARKTGGMDGLLKAGAATLANTEEVLEVARKIQDHGEKHPFGEDFVLLISGTNLTTLFRFAAENRVNFLRTPVAQVVADSKAR